MMCMTSRSLRFCRLRLLLSPNSALWSYISARAWYYCLACDQIPNTLCPGHCSAPNNRMWSSEATKHPKLVLVAAQNPPHLSPSTWGWAPSLGLQLRTEEKHRLQCWLCCVSHWPVCSGRAEQSWRLVNLCIRVPAYVRLHRNPAGVWCDLIQK